MITRESDKAVIEEEKKGLVFSRHNDLYVLLISNLTINRYGERYRY